MAKSPFDEARDALVFARRHTRPINRWPGGLLRDLDEAYRLQAVVAAALGRTCGWKVAAVTPAQRASLGVAGPIAAPLLAPWTLDGRGRRPRLRVAHFIAPRLECEIAFELARDLPPRRGTPYQRGDVEAAVAALRIGVELVDSRLPLEHDTLGEVADAFNNGGYIAGPATADWRRLDLAALPITLAMTPNGAERSTSTEIARGSPAAILDGDPFATVVMLANAQPTRGTGLQRGDIVTTGSCTGAPPLPGPGFYRADFGRLGNVDFEFAA